MASDFGYHRRAAEALTAHLAISKTFGHVRRRSDHDDPATAQWLAAVARANSAWQSVFPAHFWEEYEKLKRGDASGAETAIEFLEADPWFPQSGYVKANLANFLKRVHLDPSQISRLQSVVLNIVDKRASQEFRRYCQLARRIDGLVLREGLTSRCANADDGVRRRARWMFQALWR